MKNQATEGVETKQNPQVLKTWVAPQLEVLSVGMDTLTASGKGANDGGLSATTNKT